jgi:hypothetical protein
MYLAYVDESGDRGAAGSRTYVLACVFVKSVHWNGCLDNIIAYAAFRRVIPPPKRTVQICPTLMWDQLGTARFAAANMRAGGPSDGIILWPTK